MNVAAAPELELFDCNSCGAELTVAEHIRAVVCPYCASPSVVTRPARPDRPAPNFTVPFVVEEAAARAAVQKFLKAKIYAPNSITKASLDNVRGVYLPTYIYSAIAASDYQADIGEYYTVVETYTTTDSNGKTVTKVRTKTETEWRSLSGSHEMYIKDIVVTASKGLPNRELEAVEPFDLRVLRRFAPALIAGWTAEEASIAIGECRQQAQAESQAHISSSLEAFMPGDIHQRVQFTTSLSRESISLALLPVWIFAVRHHPKKPPVRITVNGQTAKAGGDVPVSVWKILATIFVIILLVIGVEIIRGMLAS